MSKAAELAALIGSQTALSNRNLIINGAMQVAQRGTSHQVTTATGGYFTCDRWRFSQFNSYAADVDITMSQETDTPNQTFKNSFKALVGTGTSVVAGDAIVIEQMIEGQDIVRLAQGTSDAKKFTLSFWVKASVAGTYCISLHSGKSFSSNRSHVKEYTISSANTWEYKTVTVDGDTSGTWAEDNGAGLSLGFTLGAGSTYQGAADTWSDSDYFTTSNQTQLTETTNATWFITGVQLEVGEQATPFEHEPFGIVEQKCQRYYFHTYRRGIVIGSTGTDNGAAYSRADNNANITNHHNLVVVYPTPMRATPTIKYYSLNGTVDRISHVSTGFTHVTNDSVSATYEMGERGIHGISITAGEPAIAAHLTADAEL